MIVANCPLSSKGDCCKLSAFVCRSCSGFVGPCASSRVIVFNILVCRDSSLFHQKQKLSVLESSCMPPKSGHNLVGCKAPGAPEFRRLRKQEQSKPPVPVSRVLRGGGLAPQRTRKSVLKTNLKRPAAARDRWTKKKQRKQTINCNTVDVLSYFLLFYLLRKESLQHMCSSRNVDACCLSQVSCGPPKKCPHRGCVGLRGPFSQHEGRAREQRMWYWDVQDQEEHMFCKVANFGPMVFNV